MYVGIDLLSVDREIHRITSLSVTSWDFALLVYGDTLS